MTSNRPYILRALHEWIIDNGMTPYVLVNAEMPDVAVPEQYVQDGRVVLNVSPTAVKDLLMGNDFVTFSARFSGRPSAVVLPMKAILAIYAKENGKGMIFPEEEGADGEEAGDAEAREKKPTLKVIK
ncbi:MAG: ClpXP protease specificity-enhancing factor [Gammaproteobacteria bacterium]|jgi:stringent starvation protein B